MVTVMFSKLITHLCPFLPGDGNCLSKDTKCVSKHLPYLVLSAGYADVVVLHLSAGLCA